MTDPALIPRFKKERFLLQLSEDEFRDTVIRPLLIRLGYGDGRDLCGPEEAGKDAIFTDKNRLGITDVVAIQTKKGSLNLAAKVSNNLVVAATQLKTALETSVAFAGSRQKHRPVRAILCASGKMNNAARNHIIEQVSSPNLTFLDADDLIPLLDERVPEVWNGVKVELLPYFDAIRKLVEDESVIKGQPPGATVFGVAATDTRFVSLKLGRTKMVTVRQPRGKIEKSPRFDEFPLIAIMHKAEKRVLIIGGAGSGKSTALLRLAYLMAVKGMTAGNYEIPLIVQASDVFKERPKNMADFCDLAEKLVTGRPRGCFSSEDLVHGRVVLLIDSLDELPSDEARGDVLDDIHRALVGYPKVKVVVTSRPSASVYKLGAAKGYTDYQLSALSWRQAEKILTTVKAGKRIPASQATEVLRRLEKLHGIELNPLLVTVYAATTDFSLQDIPANITELFKKFTELMLGRWEESKGFKHQYQAQVKDFVLTRIGFFLHMGRRTTISREEAEEIARRELITRGHEADAALLLTEIFDRSGLFRAVEAGIEFRHLLLQEFFAGRGIDSIDQVKLLVSDEWWKRALVFYFGEHPTHVHELESLSATLLPMAGPDLATAATTIGLALQACYLSPVGAKLRVWKWVVDSISTSMDPFVNFFSRDGSLKLLGFISYYLATREAVALTNLRGSIQDVKGWLTEQAQAGDGTSEARAFWLIVALIECGDLEGADVLLRTFRPADTRLLLAIHMGAHFIATVRPASRADRETAKRIEAQLQDAISTLVPQIVREFESILLEMRDGKPKSIEHEVEPERMTLPVESVE